MKNPAFIHHEKSIAAAHEIMSKLASLKNSIIQEHRSGSYGPALFQQLMTPVNIMQNDIRAFTVQQEEQFARHGGVFYTELALPQRRRLDIRG